MADLKISQLSAVSEVQGTDVFPTVSGLATMKASAAQIKTYVTESLDVNDSAVAGSYVTAVSEADGVISVTRETADVKPTANSTKMLTSGGAKAALDEKQNTLTFDNTPTANSNNPVKSGGVYTEVNSLKETLTNQSFTNGAVNLLPNKMTTYSSSGLVYTVDTPEKGCITVNGSLNGVIQPTIVDNWTVPKTGRYILSGRPAITTTGFNIAISIYDRTINHMLASDDYGRPVTVTLDSTHQYLIRLYLYSSTTITVTNIVFKPMITVADMPNSDYNHYVPYAKSNKELTDKLKDKEITITSSNADVSITNGKLIRKGNSLVLSIEKITFPAMTANTYLTITAITDSEMIPTQPVYALVKMLNNTSSDLLVRVGTDGSVTLFANGAISAVTNNYCHIVGIVGLI